MSKIKIAVIFGGASNEHDISLISAANIIRNLSPKKYEVIPIGITKKGRWFYYPGDVDGISASTWESHPDWDNSGTSGACPDTLCGLRRAVLRLLYGQILYTYDT